MKYLLAALCMLTVSVSRAQENKGIHFDHSTSWQEVKAKAKAENKFIFMDAFTTWCGPCKMMARNIFPLPEVGDFFNASYISLKVQLDTTANDSDSIKGWYADAHAIMKEYKVMVYPTYLFFSPDGKLVHRAVGSSDAATFVAKGKDALDPGKQYYTLVDRYQAGEKEPAFLKSLAEAALEAYDRENAAIYANAYIATQKDMLAADNIRFLDAATQSGQDAGFDIILKNQEAFDKVVGKGKASAKLKGIIIQQEVFPVIFDSPDAPDWTKLQSSLAAKYPSLADEVVANSKVVYYNNKADWPAFSAAVTAYIKKYGSKSSPEQLNNYAWTIFQNCEDVKCINQALEWSKQSVNLTNEPMFMDTYANLLYKTGKKDVAMQWEQKAIDILKKKNEDSSGYVETLGKMKKGEKTW